MTAVDAAKEGAGQVSVDAASELLVAANPARLGLEVVNTHATNWVYLGLGETAVASSGIALAPNGGSWDGTVSGVLWRGLVNAIAGGAATPVGYVEV